MNHIIILAGGKGTRMKSEMPKVLHDVAGMPIIRRLLKNIEPVCATPTIVVGYKADEVKASLGNSYSYVVQPEQLGTGHAVKCAQALVENQRFETIVVLLGDHPLVSASTIQKMLDQHAREKAAITMGTFVVPNYDGIYSVFNNFGRAIRAADGTVAKIVEYKEATEEERAVKEVNLSYYCFDASWLWQNIGTIKNENAAGEYYLTDIVEIAVGQGKRVDAYVIENMAECLGINSLEQLKMVEDELAKAS